MSLLNQFKIAGLTMQIDQVFEDVKNEKMSVKDADEKMMDILIELAELQTEEIKELRTQNESLLAKLN